MRPKPSSLSGLLYAASIMLTGVIGCNNPDFNKLNSKNEDAGYQISTPDGNNKPPFSHDGGKSDANYKPDANNKPDAGYDVGTPDGNGDPDGGQLDAGVDAGTGCQTPVRWYNDQDRDGFRSATDFIESCSSSGSYTSQESVAIDCDDNDRLTFQNLTAARDNDRDSFTIGPLETICSGTRLPIGWNSQRSEPEDCDDAVASCTTDCTSVLYINNDGDRFRGLESHRQCDASTPYTLPENAPLDCNETLFESSLDTIVSCGFMNRGTVTTSCVNGSYIPDPAGCIDPDDCVDGDRRDEIPCSRDVGICRAGTQAGVCVWNESASSYTWQFQSECSGISPSIEDPAGVPTLADEDCNGIAIRTYPLPVGLAYVGCDETIDPSLCNPSNTPLHPIELPLLHDVAGNRLNRVITDEIPLILYREAVRQGATSAPASLSSRSDPNYYNNQIKINGGWPVTAITWVQARQFCVWLGGNTEQLTQVLTDPYLHQLMDGDLPTEAEFVMAARGLYGVRNNAGEIITVDNPRSTASYTWGNDLPNCDLANFKPGANCQPDFSPIYSNGNGVGFVGAHHQNGNGKEFIFNIFVPYSGSRESDPLVDPLGPAPVAGDELRVLLGGEFDGSVGEITTMYRIGIPTDHRGVDRKTTFRCVTVTPFDSINPGE